MAVRWSTQIWALRFVAGIVALAVIAGCGASDSPDGRNASTTQPASTSALATPTASPVLQSPESAQGAASAVSAIDALSEFRGFQNVAELVDDLGPSRVFPVALMSSSTELPKDPAADLWYEFLRNARVFRARYGEIVQVDDYCEKTTTARYDSSSGNWFAGQHST